MPGGAGSPGLLSRSPMKCMAWFSSSQRPANDVSRNLLRGCWLAVRCQSLSVTLPHGAIGESHCDQYSERTAIDSEGAICSDTRPHVAVGVAKAIAAMTVDNGQGTSVVLRKPKRTPHVYVVVRRIEDSV